MQVVICRKCNQPFSTIKHREVCSKCGQQPSKYAIVNDFVAGMVAGMTLHHHRSLSESDHWIAGWDAGYQMRADKNRRIDEYLISIGQEPQATIQACNGNQATP